MQTIGERLKDLREKKGVTQKVVAEYIKVDRTGYSRYESGNAKPNYDNLLKLAEYYGTTVEYLLAGLDDETVIGKTAQTKTIKDIRDEISQNKILDVNGEHMPPDVRDDYVRQLEAPIKLRERELKIRDSQEDRSR